jgi:uncharacterized protein YcfJ
MKQTALCGLAILALAAAGCESMGTAAQSKRNQGAVLGGLLGAGTGAVIGNQTGHAGAGTAIGAGLGALGGGLMGNAMEEQDRSQQLQTTPVATNKSKFCPVGGELYGEDIKYCPTHGVELRYKEQ